MKRILASLWVLTAAVFGVGYAVFGSQKAWAAYTLRVVSSTEPSLKKLSTRPSSYYADVSHRHRE